MYKMAVIPGMGVYLNIRNSEPIKLKLCHIKADGEICLRSSHNQW